MSPRSRFTMLKHDKDVAAYSGSVLQRHVRWTARKCRSSSPTPDAAVTPPILTGHGVDGAHQVVLGAATMAQLHKRLGQYVTVTYGSAGGRAHLRSRPLGCASSARRRFPAIGFASTVSDHTSMGTGALFAFQVLPKSFAAGDSTAARPRPSTGRTSSLVRMRPGVPARCRAGQPPAHRRGGGPRLCGGAGRIRRQRHRRAGRSAPRRDRQLQDDRPHPHAPGLGAGPRRRRGAGAHAGRLGAAATARPCAAEDHRLRPTAAGRGRGLAGDGRRGRGDRGRNPARGRRGPLALGPLRASRSTPCRTPRCPYHRSSWSRWARSCWPTSSRPFPARTAARTPTAVMLRAE